MQTQDLFAMGLVRPGQTYFWSQSNSALAVLITLPASSPITSTHYEVPSQRKFNCTFTQFHYCRPICRL